MKKRKIMTGVARLIALILFITAAVPLNVIAESMDAPNIPNTSETLEYDSPNIANSAGETSEYDAPNIANSTTASSEEDTPNIPNNVVNKTGQDKPDVIIREKKPEKKRIYFVSFYYNYGSETAKNKDIDKKIMPSASENEANYVLPYCEYSRDGYVFRGWSTDRAGTEIMPYGDVLRLTAGERSLYAQWKERSKVSSFKVRFDANGGSGTMSAVTSAGGSIVYPENEFTRDGYEFLGWGVSANTLPKADAEHFFKAGSAGIYLNSETTTLYAIWNKKVINPGDIVGANGYTNNMNKSLSYNRILRRIRFKDSSGKQYTVSMNLRLAKAVTYNATGHRYTKKNDEKPVIDVANSKVYIDGKKVKINRLVVKNGQKAWVSQNSVFAPNISTENMEAYGKVTKKKQPTYYLQLKAVDDSSKSTKKAVKYLNRYFKNNPTEFEIVPIQLGKEKFKTATVASGGEKIKNLVGSTTGKSLKEDKLGKKDYVLISLENGVAKIRGTNNYNGTIKVKLK